MGHTTVAAPAPIPEMKRPALMTNMDGAPASAIGPRNSAAVRIRMASSLPYLLETGPAIKAPTRPPIVKTDWTRPH